MTIANRSPEALAAAWGIVILYKPLTKAAAIWLLDHWTIVVRTGLTLAEQQDALWHCLEHATRLQSECTPETDRTFMTTLTTSREPFNPMRHLAHA